MTWRELDDPHNPENRNAGNGGDLVKHTVYATFLTLLLEREPWCDGMHLHECHMGRALYRIAAEDPRARLVTALHRAPSLLQAAQRRALAIWALPHDGTWYAGSAAMNATLLAQDQAPHRYEGYEWAPDTRAIAGAALQAGLGNQLAMALPDGPPPARRFDGESHIASELPAWDWRHVVLLDPFGLWRHRKLAERRRRYARIIDSYLQIHEPPPLAWFFVWSHDEAGEGDMDETARPIDNGYQPLLSRLRSAGHDPLIVRWRWDLSCGMWLLPPAELRAVLRDRLVTHLGALARLVAPAAHGPERLEVDGRTCL